MKEFRELTQVLGVTYPVVQAPMFGVTTPEMVVAASRSGVLGSLALGDLSPEKCIEAIRTVKKQTDRPFAVNIFVNEVPPCNPSVKRSIYQSGPFYRRTGSRTRYGGKRTCN